MEITLWHWAAFIGFVAVLIFLDLFVFHKHSKETSLREAAGWTVIWSLMALGFMGLVYVWLGAKPAQEFLAGYLVEWSLSMDNVFVFAVIFAFFRVPRKYQYRVLFWGILSAVVMRLSFIVVLAEFLKQWDWLSVVFGGFLIWTALKLAFHDDETVHPDQNLILRMGRKILPVAQPRRIGSAAGEGPATNPHAAAQAADHSPAAHSEAEIDHGHGGLFFVIEDGRRKVTPLFLVLLVIESTDVVFAVDSVPAILALVDKNEPYYNFIAFTSNVFAILGLRALYFLLAGAMGMFRYLQSGLSAILGLVGTKMIVHYLMDTEWGKPWIPHWLHVAVETTWIPLAAIAGILAVAVTASIIADRRESQQKAAASAGGSD